MKTRTRGAYYVLLSSLILSTGFIWNAYFLRFVNPVMLAFLFFGFGFIGAVLITLMRTDIRFAPVIRKFWKQGLLLGFINSLGAIMWFHALDFIGPSLTAFVVRLSTIIGIVLGVFFLREKFTRREGLGALLALFGVWLISSADGDLRLLGLLFAIGSSFAHAIHQLLAKVFMKKIHFMLLIDYRLFFSTIFLGSFMLLSGNFEPFPLRLVPLLFIAAVVVAVIGFIYFYKGLELINNSTTAIIRNLDPFLVVVYAFVIFQDLPSLIDMVGGILIMGGVFLSITALRVKDFQHLLKWVPW